MNRFFWLIGVLCGFSLLACRTADPTVIHIRETPTATRQSIIQPSTPTNLATQSPTITVSASPLPTTSPTANPVQERTATPIPTSTRIAVPSATAVATLLTPIQRPISGQVLPINYDMLFIHEGVLQVWQPQTGQVNTLLTGTSPNLAVAGWQTTPDKQTVLVAQTKRNGDPGFTLSLFDTSTRQVRELWSESDRYLFAYALATDGRSAAIITSTASRRADEGLDVVQLIDVEQGQITTLADCPNTRLSGTDTNSFIYTSRCRSLAPVPNSSTWLWRDIEGVWQGGTTQTPRLLVPHEYFDNDPPRTFSPTNSWSPNGRYQLLLARRSEGSTRWVLDITNGQTIEIVNSVTGIEEIAYWQWTQDNRLFAVRPSFQDNGETEYLAELWHVEGDHLVQDASLTLPNTNGTLAAAPSQLSDGRFAVVINHTDPTTPSRRNLYLIAHFDQPPQPLISLPPLERRGYVYGQSLIWTPDSSGVLYTLPNSESRRHFYIPADGSALYDLTDLLGDNISRLIWLPNTN